LTLQPPRGTDPLLAKDHGVVGRCLVLDQEAPTPERDAGSRRMIHMLEALVELGWKVTFSASRPMAWDDERGALVGRIGVECLTRPFEASLRGHLRRRGADYDVVVLSRPSVAARWEGVVRRRCAGASIVYDTVDLRWRRLEGEARHHGSEALRTESSRSRARELAAARRADRVIVTSPVEAEILSVELGGRVVQVVPTYYAEPAEVRGFEQREGLLFVGGFRHAPNRDAAFWLVEEILPLVRRELGAVPVRLVGEDPPEDLVRLAGPEACPGAVDDLGPWLQGARVAVAPLLWGAGLKGKVHQSLACGLPCVATSVATEGLGGRPGRELLVADDAAGLAAAIVSLYRDPSLWEAISAGGRRLVRERYGWESFRSAVSSAVGPPPAADSVPRRERKTST
jgi:glycosyltransferase involved in cell wall biosynthesis